ncbi:MAG: hypothetical protein PHV36_00680 [Elusimicrobiales bacterium]|nr:hypothetical protein [Elusimicrobiales bacterium]
MAKNTDKRLETPETPAPSRPPEPPPSEPVSAARIWTFWTAVALAVIIARALDHMLPGIPEGQIERWVMLAFGAFVAAFLYTLK